MFPLGAVLFPGLMMPLHVFEPRYRALVDVCLAADPPELGVVLIERGSEVGGADVRTHVGTVAHIAEAARFDDGRWALAAVGVRRLRVQRWLDDDPFPQAEVHDWPDPEPVANLDDDYAEVGALLRRSLALKAELGEEAAPATVTLIADPVVGSYHAAALAPVGPADQQRLLEAPDATTRLSLLRSLLSEETEWLSRRLALG